MPKGPTFARTEPALANTIGRGPPKATYPQFHTKTSQNVDNLLIKCGNVDNFCGKL